MPATPCPNNEQPLSALQIFQLFKAEGERRGHGNNIIGFIVGTSITLRESGGCPHAYRDASKNPAGGNDRGIVQFNSKAFPNITDVQAFDPVQAISLAYDNSNGFTKWKPWSGKPLDPAQLDVALQASKDAGFNYGGTGEKLWTAIKPTWGSGQAGETAVAPPIDQAKDAVGGIVDGITSWADGLTKFLSILVDPTFWKRLGIGTLGLGVIIIALLLVFGKSAAETAAPIAGKVAML